MPVTPHKYFVEIIDKPISIDRFLVAEDSQQVMERLWYRIPSIGIIIQYKQTFNDTIYMIRLWINDIGNVTQVQMLEGGVNINEIPDEVANTSLKMLYPTISPITIGIAIAAIVIAALMITGKLKF